MAIRNPPLFLGKAGVQHPAQNDRLGLLGALAIPGAGLASTTGALHGPAGTMGELTLVNPTTLRIAPARWLISGQQNTLQGTYEVINDADLDRAITARHSSQYRRSLVVSYVADSTVTGGGADTSDVIIIDGPLSAVAPGALPDAAAILAAGAANYCSLGEIAIPPTTDAGAVTLTPYNPRTGTRHGILPVLADGLTRIGHDGAPGQFPGQYRDHPTRGLERWDATVGRWSTVAPLGVWVDDVVSTTYGANVAGYENPPSMGQRNLLVPPGRMFELECSIGQASIGAGGNLAMELYQNNTRVDGLSINNPYGGTTTAPLRMRGHYVNNTAADVSCQYSVTAVATAGTASLNAGSYGVVRLRRRIT